VARAVFLSLVKISCAITIHFFILDTRRNVNLGVRYIVFGFTSRATLKLSWQQNFRHYSANEICVIVRAPSPRGNNYSRWRRLYAARHMACAFNTNFQLQLNKFAALSQTDDDAGLSALLIPPLASEIRGRV
jgi:hypothetical protein